MSQTPMIATITKASAPILVERAGQTLTLQQGDALHATDIIQTQNAAIECLFTDGSKVLLGPQSILTVQEFTFSSEGSSCVLNLAVGVMRSITGEIVEQNPDSFKVLTPRATVGIRGTDFGIKVNADESEAYVIFSIDQGHNLVVTMHEGDMLSLTGAGQGAFIDADDLSTIQPYIFTPEEIYDFLGALFDLTDRMAIEEAHRKLWEEENSKSTEPISLLLEHNNLSSWATDVSLNFSQADMGMVLSSRINAGQIVTAVALGTVTLADTIPAAGSSSATIGSGGSAIPPISGENNYFADGDTYVSGAHTLMDHTFTISGDILSGSVISGDTQVVTGGNIVGGNDVISGGNITSGTVVGDAYSISGTGTTVQGGHDSITLTSKTGGNSIYGDAYEVKDGAAVVFGWDTITVQGDFSNTTIAGDAFIVSDESMHTWGNDVISVGNMIATTAHTTIYGDSSTPTPSDFFRSDEGSDTITALSMSATGVNAQGEQLKSSIYAGVGNDSITVGTLGENAFIYGEDGGDTITVSTFAGGTVDGGESAGDDVPGHGDRLLWDTTVNFHTIAGEIPHVTISNIEEYGFATLADNGIIEIKDSGDNVYVHTGAGGTVLGGSGNDRIFIEHLLDSTISTGAGSDLVIVDCYKSANIDTGSGSNRIVITEDVNTTVNLEANASGGTDFYYFLKQTGGSILGTDGADNIWVGASNIAAEPYKGIYLKGTWWAGGTIDGGAGDDSIAVAALEAYSDGAGGGVIKVDQGNDTIHISYFGNASVVIDGFSLGNDVFMLEGKIINTAQLLTMLTAGTTTFPHYDPAFGVALDLTFINTDFGSSPASSPNYWLDGEFPGLYGDFNSSSYTSHNISIKNDFSAEMSGDIRTDEHVRGELYFGDDTLCFTTFSGTVYGDAEEAYGFLGNDSIVVQHLQGGKIYGDTMKGDGDDGNDTITITQSMNGGEIYGGFGKDSIDIQGFFKGDVYFAHGGEDTISLNITSTTKDAANIHLGTEAGDTTHIKLSGAVEGSKLTLHDFDIDNSDGSRDYLYDAAGTLIGVTQEDLDAGFKDVAINGNDLTVYFS